MGNRDIYTFDAAEEEMARIMAEEIQKEINKEVIDSLRLHVNVLDALRPYEALHVNSPKSDPYTIRQIDKWARARDIALDHDESLVVVEDVRLHAVRFKFILPEDEVRHGKALTERCRVLSGNALAKQKQVREIL